MFFGQSFIHIGRISLFQIFFFSFCLKQLFLHVACSACGACRSNAQERKKQKKKRREREKISLVFERYSFRKEQLKFQIFSFFLKKASRIWFSQFHVELDFLAIFSRFESIHFAYEAFSVCEGTQTKGRDHSKFQENFKKV